MEKHQDSHDRLVIALLALIVLALIYIGIRLTPMHERKMPDVKSTQQIQVIDSHGPGEADNENSYTTYIYKNHGISFNLPTGFVPREENAEGGPYTSIYLPNGYGVATYIKDFTWWQKYDGQVYTKMGTETIGGNTFTIYKYNDSAYTYADQRYYMYNQGNVAYMFSVNDANKEMLKTFKFIGWQ